MAKDKQPDETVEATSRDPETGELDALTKFAQIAAQLADHRLQKAERSKKYDEILSLLATLTDDEKAELGKLPAIRQMVETAAEAPREFAAATPPGTIVNGFKKPWTWGDVDRMFHKLPIMVAQNMTIGWQGLFLHVPAMRQVYLPEPFYAEALDAIERTRTAEQHAAYLFGKAGMPDDRTVVSVQSARVRALGTPALNVFMPGGGVIPEALGGLAAAVATEEVEPEPANAG